MLYMSRVRLYLQTLDQAGKDCQGQTLTNKASPACGLYYKHVMIVNEDSRIVNKFGASPTGNTRVVIYNGHVFIVQATGLTFVGSASFSGSSLG